MQKILVIEDEPTVREMLVLNLRAEGFEVLETGDGVEGLNLAREQLPDLLLLDLMLPSLDGISVCRMLRRSSKVPIIMLTARGAELDRIMGLESGADDYVVKPFSLGELLARVRALLRRTDPAQRDSGTQLQSGDLHLDLLAQRAQLGEQELRLTHREFTLLAELMRHCNTALSREGLLSTVWGYDFPGDTHTVDVHIHWLREKIEPDPTSPRRIATVRGVGYRFEG